MTFQFILVDMFNLNIEFVFHVKNKIKKNKILCLICISIVLKSN